MAEAGYPRLPALVVKHPFGFNFAQMMGLAEVGDTVRTWPIMLSCLGVARLRLAGNAKTLASQSWPDSHPRFWTFAAADADGKAETSKHFTARWTSARFIGPATDYWS
jgi:hypothetical protein